jgi:multiple sugar transport system permease protein
MDGCGPWRIYWKIILPLSIPVLATAAIFTFIWTWDDFFAPLIYLSDTARPTPCPCWGCAPSPTPAENRTYGALFAMSVLTLVPDASSSSSSSSASSSKGIATTGMKR